MFGTSINKSIPNSRNGFHPPTTRKSTRTWSFFLHMALQTSYRCARQLRKCASVYVRCVRTWGRGCVCVYACMCVRVCLCMYLPTLSCLDDRAVAGSQSLSWGCLHRFVCTVFLLSLGFITSFCYCAEVLLWHGLQFTGVFALRPLIASLLL